MFDIGNCIRLYGVMTICVGDYVEVYLKGLRSMTYLRGVVQGFSESAILLKTNKYEVMIRINEVRAVVRVTEDKKNT